MGYAAIIKLADGTSASADATKKNAPQRKVGPRRRVGGASAGERRDAGSRDAPADASETRRRYPADEVSRCGRWMQRAGGVELFPGGRDEHASPWPSSRGCHARPRSGSCRAEPFWARWIRQDCGPTAYMYTPSGAKDAGIGRSRKASTVARNKAARCQANQHSTEGYRALSRNSPRRERAAATNRTARRNTTKRDPPLRKQGPRCSSGNCRAPSSGCRRSTHRRRRPCACPSISTPSSPFQSRAGQRP